MMRDKRREGGSIGKVRISRDLQDLHLAGSKVGIRESSYSQIHLDAFLSLGKVE
jgi:hypothetical protein